MKCWHNKIVSWIPGIWLNISQSADDYQGEQHVWFLVLFACGCHVTNITLHLRPIFLDYFTAIWPTQWRYKVVWKKMMSANWSHLKMLCFHFSKKMCQMNNILYVQADLEAVKLYLNYFQLILCMVYVYHNVYRRLWMVKSWVESGLNCVKFLKFKWNWRFFK